MKTHRFRHANPDTPAAKARKRRHNTREYRDAGRRAEAQVRAGQAHCWRCHTRIPADAVRGPHWQLGHHDWNLDLIMGPECTPCNRTAAARKGNAVQRRVRHSMPRRQSRAW